MTNPPNAYQNPGRGRYYRHPTSGEEWPSVTNVLDTAISKPALVPWAAKVTAAKAWQMLPQMVATSRKPAEAEALTKIIKGEIRIVKDMAADLGSRIHAQVEADVLGKPVPEDEEVAPFVAQAFEFFSDFGVDLERDIEATEATVINRTVGYAGTGDLWLWLRLNGKRRLLVVDYKTSRDPQCSLHGRYPTKKGACLCRAVDSVYPEQGMQVAAIAKAEKVLLDNGEEVDPPGPIEGTAILNLRHDRYALIPMPIAGTVDDAFAAFCGALATARYVHSCYGVKSAAVAKPVLKVA